MRIHLSLLFTMAFTLLPLPVIAQAPSFNPMPFTAFESRNSGKTLEHEPNLKQPRKTTKTVTFTAVTDVRDWKGANGTVIQAQLLAFERTTPAADSPLPIIRDDKVRLLVHGAQQVSMIPMASLSTGDQVFIRNLDAVRRAAASPTARATGD